PNDSITREEVAVVLSRAFYLLDAEADLSGHADAGSISSWARDGMAALVKLGHLRGYPDGTLRPKRTITREEFAQIMARLVTRYITAPGEYTFESDGAVVIRVPGVTLKGCVLTGDLILGDDVARADVTLENTVFITPPGATAAPRLSVRAEALVVEVDDGGAPLAGPGSGEGTGTPGGGSSTPTYTLDIDLSSPSQSVSTQRETGLSGDGEAGLFYLVLRDHLRRNVAHLKGQLTQNFPSTGLFGPLFETFRDDVSLDMLADMTEVLQYVAVAPGSAAGADKWKNPYIHLRDLVGESTLIFDDAPFYAEVLVDIGQANGSYTLQLTVTGSVSGLTVSSSLLTGSNRLYDHVFASVGRRLDALLTRYELDANIAAGDYMDQVETWFNSVPPDDLGTWITVRQGSLSPLLDRDVSLAAVSGCDFTLRGPGFTLDVSVR
ncbi:MAG: S-layer homology domain-containing protein, partial [Oscillospiraceae bacterium]|nr:S-layer homology domain-containing protein [Oscillospiraceae bacterium]